ncbi:hypothetical protein F5146DRAFT_1143280 [Armillaria mellea]|nr:hypothetical protein F5146DRAFT_1143280 [Armillaria mellea]
MVVRAIGSGFEASKRLAGIDPKLLILACRNEEKGKDAALQRHDGRALNYGRREFWKRDVADKYAHKVGVSPFGNYDVVEDWKNCLHTNYFGPWIVGRSPNPQDDQDCLELRDPDLRSVVVASDAHYCTTFEDELVELPNVLTKLSSKEYCIAE